MMIEAIKFKIYNLLQYNLLNLQKIESTSLRSRIIKGTFWSLAGAIISRGSALICSIIIARILGKNIFGEYGIIQSTIGMFCIFTGFGLGMTATKYIAELKKNNTDRVGQIIGVIKIISLGSGILFSTILYFYSAWLSTNILAAAHLNKTLEICSVLLLTSTYLGAQIGIISGFELFKQHAKVNIIIGIINIPIIIFGIFWGGLYGIIWSLIFSTIINIYLNSNVIGKEIYRLNIKIEYFSFDEFKIIWHFSLPAMLSSSMVAPINWVCNTIIINQANGYAELGVFNAANQWFNMIMFLPGIISQVTVPILSEKISIKNYHDVKKILKSTILFCIIIMIPFSSILCFKSHLIMSLYGDSFSEGWVVLIITVLTATILSILTPIGNLIVSSGKMWLGFIMNFGWGFVYLIVTFFLKEYGAKGLASSRLVAYLVHTLWTLGYARHMMKKY